ncbi:hypothetical protein B9G53_22550 [Pseudanabaena sp. SR411]|uniref:S-layer homology domain-containing protein n=1 Tax=Pseudanabaena sp. SR411 TaxID=1980935 RepID=UPI000B997D08|nr:S-layer homology domain-containing protein [Pseudanabaena sp. SR411]OYQ62353.1 hypothetical protein B9G53_22550 [Pseudanabaena sp. SR411]
MLPNLTAFVSQCLLFSSTLITVLVPVQETIAAQGTVRVPKQSEVSNTSNTPMLISQNLGRSYMLNYATSINEVSDVRPTDWGFQSLQSAIERARFIRLYSDGTFRGNQSATRFEMIDWFGTALNVVFTFGENQCNFSRPRRSFNPSSNIDSTAFYYQSYLAIGNATGGELLYQPSSGNSESSGDSELTRADAAIILNRYFLRPIEAFAKRTSSIDSHEYASKSLLSKDKTQLAQMPSAAQISDISPNDRYYKDIESAVSRWGILSAYPDGTFRAKQPISRYELASILSASFDKANEFIASQCTSSSESSSVVDRQPSVTIVNNTNGNIVYSLDGTTFNLSPGESKKHSNGQFMVEFDSSFMDGYQSTRYTLRSGTTNRFNRNGNFVDLLFD